MRVNVYAEEMTERVEIIAKEIDGQKFTGLRLYLELPATETLHTIGNHEHVEETTTRQVRGPFMHRPGDDDSAAVTFWGKRDLRGVLLIMLRKLNEHYGPQREDEFCICADIIGTDKTRHFKECPLRATWPEPPISVAIKMGAKRALCNVHAEIKEGLKYTSGWCCLEHNHPGGHQYRIGNGS